ncbi:hypothetical protein D7W79_34670 [Corallococcus exercitus]|uniref:DUF3137 domain-containing protein n=1 Tax=Corallococcus exercitus TaxID=2316736 RepID=A0A3A8HA37_9BACT|nr:hypothetical protein [Corallococcus exercitus]NOK33479.1 hypothetical protein [Corallococcus exercitus]RKG68022.1 hypothetical protein D7W79_34670 [Corallococcus exercitus]
MPLREFHQVPVPQVLDFLDTLQRDERREALRKPGRWRTLVFSGLIVTCLVLCLVYPEPVSQFAGFMAVWLGCALAIIRHSLYSPRFGGRVNPFVGFELCTRRPELVAVLLRRLQRDLPADGTVSLKLRPEPIPTGPGSPEPPADMPDTPTWTKVDAWLELKTRLADGAHLRLGIQEKRRCQVRERPAPTKPNRLKLKYRDVLYVELALRVKARRHPELAALTEAEARRCVRLPDGVTFRRLRVSADALRLQVHVREPWCARLPKGLTHGGDGKLVPQEAAFWRTRMSRLDLSRVLTGLLLSLYQMLHVARHPLPPLPPPEPAPAPLAKPERGRKKRRGRRAV